MKYCKQCIMPDTRPSIQINSAGICSACIGHKEKEKYIDWGKRKAEFELVIKNVKRKNSGYDCIVPVSGGKDSTYQVIKCLDYNLRVLAVSWKTPARTKIGQQNLDNLVRLGVDHIDYTINPEVERRFMHKALIIKGDTALPMHMAIYSIPLNLAIAYNIPLVVWGESPHLEYGGEEDERSIKCLDLEWFNRHSILQGTSAEEWVDKDLTYKDLEAYFLPTEKEYKERSIKSIFLGYYFKWDPETNLQRAQLRGFKVRSEGPKTGYYNYADIDCNFISVHHYFKWLKFGFTRLFDNLSVEIRNGRKTRKEALQIISREAEQTPNEDIKKLCSFLKINENYFHKIAERFRNKDIWVYKKHKWVIKDFIIKNWDWK